LSSYRNWMLYLRTLGSMTMGKGLIFYFRIGVWKWVNFIFRSFIKAHGDVFDVEYIYYWPCLWCRIHLLLKKKYFERKYEHTELILLRLTCNINKGTYISILICLQANQLRFMDQQLFVEPLCKSLKLIIRMIWRNSTATY
jgi:hypothetical protein